MNNEIYCCLYSFTGMFVNNESTSYKTYCSIFCREGEIFNISGNFRQTLILYPLHAKCFRYLPITFTALYIVAPAWSTIRPNFIFPTILYQEHENCLSCCI